MCSLEQCDDLLNCRWARRKIFGEGPPFFEALFQPNEMENFSAEVVAAADAKAEGTVKQIEKALQTPTCWFDRHLSDFDRVTAARAKYHPGIFHLSLPAWHFVSAIKS